VLAGVSRQGYYAWRSLKNLPAFDHNDYIVIKGIFDATKGKFGAKRVLMALLRSGERMSLNKVRRIMKKYRLVTTVRKANPYKKAPQSTEVTVSENLLNRAFTQTDVYRYFCTDITYIRWGTLFVYVSSIKDIASGEIVAWKCSVHIDIQLVLDTVAHLERNLMTHVWSLKGALMHSDRGTHYTGPQWLAAMKRLGIVRSMSRVGRCIDNAPKESFFGHMKDEMDIKDCKTFDAVAFRIDQYMRYYNHDRPQWEKRKMTPVEYRDHLLRA
jgi:putative transposase